MEEWIIPDYNSYYPPETGVLRAQNGTYRLSSQLNWPLSLRDLFGITCVLLWWIYLLVEVSTSGGQDLKWRPGVIVGLVGILALGTLIVKRRARRALLTGPQLQLPQARLVAGSQTAVRFQHSLTDTGGVPSGGRLLARMLCLEIIYTNEDPNFLQQRLLSRSDLPPHDVEPGAREVDSVWILNLEPDAPASYVPGWPRLLWVMQVRLELQGQPTQDIRFLLPVAVSDESGIQATPSTGKQRGGDMGSTERNHVSPRRVAGAAPAGSAHPAHLPATPLLPEVAT